MALGSWSKDQGDQKFKRSHVGRVGYKVGGSGEGKNELDLVVSLWKASERADCKE